MKTLLRRCFVDPILHPSIVRRFGPLVRNTVTVFMLHRFTDRELGSQGHDPDQLRGHLEYLRQEGFRILSLDEVLDAVLGRGLPLGRSVSFTVDDAYADFVTAGAPIFQEFDAPVTLFVPTGFVDQEYWPWWNRLEYMFLQTSRTSVQLNLPDLPWHPGNEREVPARSVLALDWAPDSEAARRAAQRQVVHVLKPFPDELREEFIQTMSSQLDVGVPESAPSQYRAATWDELRRVKSLGTTLAPHTVTHPNLARCSADQVAWEARESLARLRSEVGEVPPVFAFPYGLVDHLGNQTELALEQAGIRAAFTAVPGYVRRGSASPYHLPRFSYPEDRRTFARIVFGLERLREALPLI